MELEVKKKNHELLSQKDLDSRALVLTSCVTLSKLRPVSEPLLPHLVMVVRTSSEEVVRTVSNTY